MNRIGITVDMKMNANKTKNMLMSKYVTLTEVSLNIDVDIIKQTDNYTYLGQTITSIVNLQYMASIQWRHHRWTCEMSTIRLKRLQAGQLSG